MNKMRVQVQQDWQACTVGLSLLSTREAMTALQNLSQFPMTEESQGGPMHAVTTNKGCQVLKNLLHKFHNLNFILQTP